MKLLFFLLMFCASLGFSQDSSSLIPIEKFFDNPQVDNCQISPDGKRFSCLKPYQGKLNVFVRDIESKEEHAVTSEKERPVLNYFWSFDSKNILYLQDHLGDENYHLFKVVVENKTPD